MAKLFQPKLFSLLRDGIGKEQVTVILSGVAPEVRKNINNLKDAGLNDDFICDSFNEALEKAKAELKNHYISI